MKHLWFFRYDIFIFLLIESIAIFLFYQEFLNSKRQVLKENENTVEMAYNAVMEMYAQMALVVYDEVLNQPDVLACINAMRQTEAQEQRAALQTQLFRMMYPAYLHLRERPDFSRQFANGFRTLETATPYLPGENLDSLRITLPDGTVLTEIPRSHAGQQEHSEAFSAFQHDDTVKSTIDLDATHPGIRYQFPLSANQQKIGMAEIGFSFYGLREKIERLLQCEILFLFRKDAFHLHRSQTIDYTQSVLSQEYVQDRLKVFVREGRATIERLNEQLAEQIPRFMQSAAGGFVMNAAVEKRNFLITFYPLCNHQRSILGYMVLYRPNAHLAEYAANFWCKSAISVMIVLFAVMIYRRTQEIREAKKLFGALHHVGEVVAAELHIDAIFHAVTKGAARLLNTDSSVIHLLDDSGETLRATGAYGLNAYYQTPGGHDRIEESLVGRVIRMNTPLILNDLPRIHTIHEHEADRFHENWYSLKFLTIDGNAASLLNLYHTRRKGYHSSSFRQRVGGDHFYRYAMDNEGVVALASVPLQIGNRIIGTLDVLSKRYRQAFRSKHLKMLRLLADQAAIAIENAQLYETLRQESIRDQLTGLYNRRYMEEALTQAVCSAKRRKCPISILLFDVDHFKHVNDTYGHRAGDRVLREIGNLLQVNVRGEDIACRYGGEEFLVILIGASLANAMQRAEEFRVAVQHLHICCEETIMVTISIGVAVLLDHENDIGEVIANADKALYLAKHSGRNQVRSW
ncbi:PAS fold family [Candidatus Moduliflexus flocculans]|uniref:PAS fold family n=1 Tax=Candidatus Moduliflexus flocculans TaxID=1499966 RepID=A0A081BLF2_9BACT|nr:PAS fold family [Candidatus Moduliflexus flocculans]